MELVHVPGPAAAGPPVDVRAARRALRTEKAQLLRWRRLVRSRLDLAVAGFLPPEPLGSVAWDLVPAAQLALPRPHELTAAVRIPAAEDPVELLNRLRALDQALATYGRALDEALESSTQALLCGLAAEDVESAAGVAEAR